MENVMFNYLDKLYGKGNLGGSKSFRTKKDNVPRVCVGRLINENFDYENNNDNKEISRRHT